MIVRIWNGKLELQYEKKCWEMDFASRSEAQFLEYLSVGSFGTVYKHQSSLRRGRSTVGTLETSRIVWDLGLVPL